MNKQQQQPLVATAVSGSTTVPAASDPLGPMYDFSPNRPTRHTSRVSTTSSETGGVVRRAMRRSWRYLLTVSCNCSQQAYDIVTGEELLPVGHGQALRTQQ